jgi:hypothetical protein
MLVTLGDLGRDDFKIRCRFGAGADGASPAYFDPVNHLAHIVDESVTDTYLVLVYTSTMRMQGNEPMSVRVHIQMTPTMHKRLVDIANRTGLGVAELMRRAAEQKYWPDELPKMKGFEVSVGFWKRPSAAIVGRRPGIKLAD